MRELNWNAINGKDKKYKILIWSLTLGINHGWNVMNTGST